MKVIFAFLLGMAIGTAIIYRYVRENHSSQSVLSEEVEVTQVPQEESGFNKTQYYLAEKTHTPSPEPTKILATVAPTKLVKPTLKPTATPTPTSKTTPTIYPSPTPTVPTALPATTTPTPATTSIQTTYTSQEINGFIERFAGQYGVDSNVLRHIAVCESGFNASVISSNGLYGGLYQFSVGAWNTYRGQIGEDKNTDLRFDAEEAVQTAAYVMSLGMSSIWPNCVP